jgi:TPR repeat protein
MRFWHFFGLFFTLLVFQSAHAIAEPPMPLKVMKAQELLALNAERYFKAFDLAIEGECSSFLDRLKKDLQTDDKAYAAHIVLGEMYDRVICVPFDPYEAFQHFKAAADLGGSMYYAIVGWKYENGHGVSKSEENAKKMYKLLIQRSSFSDKGIKETYFASLLNDRTFPTLLRKGLNWYNAHTNSQEKIFSYAKTMIDGSGKYYDGSAMPVELKTGYMLLERLENNNPAAGYFLAQEELKGTFGPEKQKKGHTHLIMIARCGYVPAMLKLSELANVTGSKHYKPRDMYGWLWLAWKNGANVADKLEKARQTVSFAIQYTAENGFYYKVHCAKGCSTDCASER